MPIEREYKFVLDFERDVESRLKFHNEIRFGMEIKQGYLGQEGRVRSKKTFMKDGQHIIGETPQLWFTYKHPLSIQENAVLEIETKMTEDDFDLAWPDTTKRIHKRRYVVEKDNLFWEFDFFINDEGKTYFALAECEIGLNDPVPEFPASMNDIVIFKVPSEDNRFQNVKLSCSDYASKLYSELRAERRNNI